MTQSNAKNEITLEIDSLTYGPYGVGRSGGQVIMVPYTAPGDRVEARITEAKGNYSLGEIIRLIAPSPQRQPPPCPYFSACGGCPWQHIAYETQLKAKQQSVEDALRRIGKLDGFELRPIIPSPREYHYRRRIRLQCDKGKRVGFFRAASHDLVEIDACLIADPKLNDIIEPVRRWIMELVTAIDHVEIVTGDKPNQIVVVGKIAAAFIPRDELACERLVHQVAGISGLVLHNRDWRRTWGQTAISAVSGGGVDLKAEGDVFTQINSDGNRKMLGEILAAGEFNSHDRVLELYCGAGNFTLSVARRTREVVAVEGSRPAMESGKRSAQMSGLGNIHWVRAHVPAALARLRNHREEFSKVILDPPRAGAKGIERDLVSFGAQKILYVSCNPTTLARDLSALAKYDYKLRMVQPIDLFPHTFHVEALAVLTV